MNCCLYWSYICHRLLHVIPLFCTILDPVIVYSRVIHCYCDHFSPWTLLSLTKKTECCAVVYVIRPPPLCPFLLTSFLLLSNVICSTLHSQVLVFRNVIFLTHLIRPLAAQIKLVLLCCVFDVYTMVTATQSIQHCCVLFTRI